MNKEDLFLIELLSSVSSITLYVISLNFLIIFCIFEKSDKIELDSIFVFLILSNSLCIGKLN